MTDQRAIIGADSETGGKRPSPLQFAYYIQDDGTRCDKDRSREDLLRLIDLGFIGFDDTPDRMVVYQPFVLGARIPNRGRREKYLGHTAPGEC